MTSNETVIDSFPSMPRNIRKAVYATREQAKIYFIKTEIYQQRLFDLKNYQFSSTKEGGDVREIFEMVLKKILVGIQTMGNVDTIWVLIVSTIPGLNYV